MHESTDGDAARPAAYFGCPQQPSLRLPMSRVNDGICDCCDGADESSDDASSSSSSGTTRTSCPDICDVVLAEEREALAKMRADYEIGSKRRAASISQYDGWHAVTREKLRQLKDVELEEATREQERREESLRIAMVTFGGDWLSDILGQVEDADRDLVDIASMGRSVNGGDVDSNTVASDLALFIVSLCQLSAEASSGNVANDRCLALDRASLDLGLLWNHNGDGDGAGSLPTFAHVLKEESALMEYANDIVLRLEGKDSKATSTISSRDQSRAASARIRKEKAREQEKERHHHEYDSGDDLYGDDWEDSPDYHYEDDFAGEEEEDDLHYHDMESESHGLEEEGEKAEEEESEKSSINESLLKLLLDGLPIDRTLFKEQSERLLKFSLEENKDEDGQAVVDDREVRDKADSEEEDEESTSGDSGGVDPMAVQMVKSNLSKSLSNISRGEMCARSAARYVTSLIVTSMTENNHDYSPPLRELQRLAILTLYHSKVSSEDVAELVYMMSAVLGKVVTEDDTNDECDVSWSNMCPPRTIQIGDRSYPPSFIVEAARKRCERLENSPGVCGVQAEGDEIDFPSSIPDGYYNYYAPKSKTSSDDEDALVAYFSGMESMHEKVPASISDLKKQKEAADRSRKSLTKKVADLESELGGDSGSKYGPDGELYIMRDTCHKVESGKYEYEVCIFGRASQRDIGQTSGGTNLGSWDKIDSADDGQRTLKWRGGTKCWNGPVRSAEVVVTCGAETKMLTADEPETCRYVFTMESPIGCDERFKVKNSL